MNLISLSSFQAKGQEDIPGPRGDPAVARVHKDHSAGYDQRRAVDTRTGGLDAVYRREFLVGVELPEDGSICRRVGAKAAVVRACNDGAGNQCDRAPLCRTAALLPSAEPWIRTGHAPDFCPGGKFHGPQAAGVLALTVANTKVNVLTVGRRAPLAAQTAALTETVFPHEFSGVGIESVRDTGLLRSDEELPVARRGKQRRCRKIEVGSLHFGAAQIPSIARAAAAQPVVVCGSLVDPFH